MEKFNLNNEKPKKSLKEKYQNYKERFKKTMKPIFKNAIIVLTSLEVGFWAELYKDNHSQDEYWHKNYKEAGFNYYSPDILKDFDTFYAHVKNDEKITKTNTIYMTTDPIENPSDRRMSFLRAVIKNVHASQEIKEKSKRKLEFYKKLIEDYDNKNVVVLYDKYEKMKEQNEDVLHQKEWLKKIVGSDAYLQKLMKETGGDLETAKKIQSERLERLKIYGHVFSNNPSLSSPNASGHVWSSGNEKYTAAIHNEQGYGLNATPLHEFEHQETMDLMTDYADSIYKNYFSEKDLKNYQLEKINYYKDPLELQARKRVLDYELEVRGIKKYDEEFTEKHYKTIKSLMEKGNLDPNSEQFFRSFEKDAIMLIMNTVAEIIDKEENDNKELQA